MKKKLLLSVAVASLTIAPVATLFTSCSKKSKLSEVHIININDFHGAAPGYGDLEFEQTNINNPGAIRLVNEWEAIKAKYPGSVVLGGGDYNAGEGFSTCKQGETFYPVLKQMGILYSTVGNHAWEWGSESLENYHYDHMARTDETVGSYFFTSNVLNGANYREKTWVSDPTSYRFAEDYNLWKQIRVPWADPFKMLNLNGHNVCLIGLTTKDTLTDGNMESMKTLSFIDYNAAVVYSKMYAYETLGEDEYEKIDAFILDTHLECQAKDKDKPFDGVVGEAEVLARELTTPVDAIFAGHSHMICSGISHNEKLNKDIPIAQGGQSGRRYVDAALVFDDSKKAGKRLKSVTLNVVKPNIAGISDPDHPDKEAATKQLIDILTNTTNDRVLATAYEYYTQRNIALNDLLNPIGKMFKQQIKQGSETKYGLPYWYTDDDKGFGTNFLQSPTLLEPAGVWANIAMIDSFNKRYAPYIEAEFCYPVSVAFTNLDSLKSGFLIDEKGQDKEDITKKQVFQMHAFENAMHYGCITVDQLEQYIEYFLAGDGENGFDYGNKTKYPGTFYYDDAHKEEVQWDANETVNVLDKTQTTLGTSYTSGVNQFYGISFAVKKSAEPTGKTKFGDTYKYTYEKGTLKIYDPTDSDNDLYKPETWKAASVWKEKGRLIPIVIASFTWQGGNAQNRMLHHWFDYNGKKDWTARHIIFDMYTRNSALDYIDSLTGEGWAINQIAADPNQYIDDAFISKLLTINA